MQSSPTILPPKPGSAAERLLDAAAIVFARDGIGRATTRDIAKEADVNEVTLFRNFQNKQGLLAAVLERIFLPTGNGVPEVSMTKGASIAEVLKAFAAADFARKRQNVTLMRVLVGELHRLGSHEKEILVRIFQPWKEELATQIKEAQRLGAVRPEINPALIVDQLVSMLFIGAIRAEKMCGLGYTPEEYLDSCVNTILCGIVGPREVEKPGQK